MNGSTKCGDKMSEKSKIRGLSYACTDNGIRLPVVDITHPLFEASLDEESLADLCKESTQKAKDLKEMSDSHKKLLGERSYIFKGFFLLGRFTLSIFFSMSICFANVTGGSLRCFCL